MATGTPYHAKNPGCHTRKCDERVGKLEWRIKERKRQRRLARELAQGWAIPQYVVICESKEQNLSPNSAGASGYYQIIPGTWAAYGGKVYAKEAWKATKAQQGIIARKILHDSPRGLGEWNCA